MGSDEEQNIILRPNEPDAREYIFITGIRLESLEGQQLNHKDRIILGSNTILLYMKSSTGTDYVDIDWESAQVELQKEIELNNKKVEEENERKKQEELHSLKKDLEEKYHREKQDLEDKLVKQLSDYENKIKEMNQSAEKSVLEADRIKLQNSINQRMEALEAEKARRKREVEIREKNDMIGRENIKKNKEFIHKSEKMELTLQNIVKKLNKMKIIIAELKRNISMDIFLSKNLLDYFSDNRNSQVNILIRVENYEEGTVYYWTTETFQNRYDMMKTLIYLI